MVVFFRHGKKSYLNGKTPPKLGLSPWDPPIVHPELVVESAKTLPLITRMIVSPYLRCRQTATLILNTLKQRYGNNIQVIYEPLIREYLGQWGHRNVYVDKETLDLMQGTKLVETVHEYQMRADEFYLKYELKETDCVVTHSMLVAHLTRKFYNGKIDLHQGKCVILTTPCYLIFNAENFLKNWKDQIGEIDSDFALRDLKKNGMIYLSDSNFTYESPELSYSYVKRVTKEKDIIINLQEKYGKTKNITIFKIFDDGDLDDICFKVIKAFKMFEYELVDELKSIMSFTIRDRVMNVDEESGEESEDDLLDSEQ